MMGYNLGKYTGKQICIKPVENQTKTKVRKKVVKSRDASASKNIPVI